MAEILSVRNIVKHFPVRKGFLGRKAGVVHAVDGVSFGLEENQSLGLVGESGCGKSTMAFCLLRLIEPTSGQVFFEGRNIIAMQSEKLRRLRREIQIVFQDPFRSLNPRMTVERIIEEPLLNHEVLTKTQRRDRIVESLETVGLLPEHLRRFPHEFSGGQCQRICVARALILRPKVIVGDEPVSALDVSVQAQVLNLMVRLQQQMKLSYIFISHDLAVIRYISHRVAVMYLGQIVEMAEVKELYAHPLHPYTKALLSGVPVPDPHHKRQRTILRGDVPSPLNPPRGCRFHPRCPERLPVCSREMPVTRLAAPEHLVHCHLYSDKPGWEWNELRNNK